MALNRPSGYILLITFLIFTTYIDKFLRDDIRDYWKLHRFSFEAFLELRYKDIWAQIRPDSHAIYPYRVYYDDLASPPKYRITAISKCLFDNTAVSISVVNKTLDAMITPIADYHCPSRFFSSYNWTSYEFSVPSEVKRGSIELIVNGTRRTNLPVLERPRVPQTGKLEVCISVPVYWYDDWPRMITFFELWREVHDAYFTIYVQSITKNVRAVLEHYSKLGILTVVPWPYLPTHSGSENANRGTFSLANLMAQNDCLLRSDAEVGVMLDLDEFIFIKSNISLIEFMRKKNERIQDLGSLRFSSVGMKMATLDGTFDSIGTESITKDVSPKKVAFYPNRLDTIWTHGVWKHVGNYNLHEVNSEEAVVVHVRQTHIREIINNQTDLGIAKLPFFSNTFKNKLRQRKLDIFGNSSPIFIPRKVVKVIDQCFLSLTKHRTGRFTDARIIPWECKEKVKGLDDWIEYDETEDSMFTFL